MPVLLAAALLGVAGLQLGVSRSQAAVSPTMRATVHEDQTISLVFDDGTPVGNQARTPPTIPPGTYTIRVVDDTDEHNFHLAGPGVDQATSVGGSASPTWTVTLQPGGEYRFQCDTHFDFMFGVFDTSGTSSSSGSSAGSGSSSSSGSASSSGSGSSSSPSGAGSSLRGTLAGKLTAAGKLTLTIGGKPVSRLKSGRYRITLVDAAPSLGALMRATGRGPITLSGSAFVGTRTLTVALSAGRWTLSTSTGKSKTAFTVVA
jgi:plastocyanin